MLNTEEKIKDVLGHVVKAGDTVILLVKEYGYRKISDAYLSKAVYCGKGSYGYEFVRSYDRFLAYKEGKSNIRPDSFKTPQVVRIASAKDMPHDWWIKFTPDSFATDEDWEDACDTAGVSPDEAVSVTLYVCDSDYELSDENEDEEEEDD